MKKVFLIIALVLVALLVVTISFARFSCHWTCEKQNLSSICSSGSVSTQPRPTKLDTYSKIAIVPLPCDKTSSALQTEVVKKLREALSKEELVYHLKRYPIQRASWGASYSTSLPESVNIYSSEQEAVKHHSDYIIFVKPKLWKYPGLFFRRNWQANVEFKAGPPGFTHLSEVNDKTPQPYYTFELNTEGTGTVKGIFSTSYLTSMVAETMAKEATKQMANGLKKIAEEYQTN